MKKLFSLMLLLFTAITFANAQDVTGVWKTIDDETGEAKSYVTIYEKGGEYFGKVTEILNKDRQDAVCDSCSKKDERYNQPIQGMIIMRNMKKVRTGTLKGGKILKPTNGKEYKCEVYLQDDTDHLVVKGCIGPVCKKQNWYRVK